MTTIRDYATGRALALPAAQGLAAAATPMMCSIRDRVGASAVVRAVPLFMVFLILTGCNQGTPEGRLEQAGEQVEVAREDLQALNERISAHRTSLAQLEKDRRRAKSQLQTLQERLQNRATDLAIFRAVQTAVLQDPALTESAITVSVDDAVVTLGGVASDSAGELAALDHAKAVPGVTSVSSNIVVDVVEQQ